MNEPKYNSVFWAFIVGGVIAVITQGILQIYLMFVEDFMMAVRFTLFTHAAIGSILAALGVYGKLEAKSGMGAVIPLTGLAAAITGSIMGERAKGSSTAKALKDGLKIPLLILATAFVIGLVGAIIMYFVG